MAHRVYIYLHVIACKMSPFRQAAKPPCGSTSLLPEDPQACKQAENFVDRLALILDSIADHTHRRTLAR